MALNSHFRASNDDNARRDARGNGVMYKRNVTFSFDSRNRQVPSTIIYAHKKKTQNNCVVLFEKKSR